MSSSSIRRWMLIVTCLLLITFVVDALPLSGFYVNKLGDVYRTGDGRSLTLVSRTTNFLGKPVYYSASGTVWLETDEVWMPANLNDCALVSQLPVIGFPSSRDQVNGSCFQSQSLTPQLLIQRNDLKVIQFVDVLGCPVKEVDVADWSNAQIAAHIADVSSNMHAAVITVGYTADGNPILISKLTY